MIDYVVKVLPPDKKTVKVDAPSVIGVRLGNPQSVTMLEQDQIIVEFTSDVNGQIDVPLTHSLTGQSWLFINGLMQSQGSYHANSSVLVVPSSLSVEVGDLVTFVYR